MSNGEFDLIQRFFNQEKQARRDVICGIGDDAAVLAVPKGQQLVVTTDTLVAGRHFPKTTLAADIAYKALAVNLSDLAAMGAKPAWVMLALTLPSADETWLVKFSRTFFSLLNQFGLQLVGGDVTQGALSITIQAMGFVPAGKALLRSGAKPDDRIYVTGTLGDAGLALAYLQKKLPLTLNKRQNQSLMQRLNRPEARIAVGLALRNIASSAIDISDGLAADLSHILAASRVGAIIDLDKLPLSKILQKLASKAAWQFALSVGDDYELCFTVPKSRELKLQNFLNNIACPFTRIGIITRKKGLLLKQQDGTLFILEKQGFQHFSVDGYT